MHTSFFKTCIINHNGGYDGDCAIKAKGFDDETKEYEIRVDFNDLRNLVFDYLKMEHEAYLEEIEDKDFVKHLIKNM